MLTILLSSPLKCLAVPIDVDIAFDETYICPLYYLIQGVGIDVGFPYFTHTSLPWSLCIPLTQLLKLFLARICCCGWFLCIELFDSFEGIFDVDSFDTFAILVCSWPLQRHPSFFVKFFSFKSVVLCKLYSTEAYL